MKVILDDSNPKDAKLIEWLVTPNHETKDLSSQDIPGPQAPDKIETKKGNIVKGEVTHINGAIDAITKDNTRFKLKDGKDWYFFGGGSIGFEVGDSITGDYHKTAFKNKPKN